MVFIASKADHGPRGNHEFFAGSLYLARRINAVYPRAYAVVTSEDQWPTDLSKADAVIVLLNHGGRAAADPNIKAAMARGAGFMAIHFGVEVSKGEQGKNYLDWMGGYFETFWSVNPWWTPDLEVNASHPTGRGVKPFQVKDEWYYHMRFREGMQGVRHMTIRRITFGGPSTKALHRQTIRVENPHRVEGKRVLLLDDITKSGASLLACREMLYEAGATLVQAMALGKVIVAAR
jgi:phosphoribosylpyrophosphate synthetase